MADRLNAGRGWIVPTLFTAAVLLILALGRPQDVKAEAAGKTPAVGERAPDFTLPYATADTIVFKATSLQDAVKKGPIVLAFYPADWSSGCTKEVCTFRDDFADLASLHAEIWGVSCDQVFCHRAWAQHHKLPFRLVGDHKHEAAGAYGVYDEKSGFDHRSVFVVGSDGNVRYADPEYSVADASDFEALKKALASIH